MKKYIKYFIVFSCLFIYILLSINVYNDKVMVSDGIVYDLIDKYLVRDNVTPIVKVITNIGDIICIGIVTIISLVTLRDKKINYSIVINLIIITILNVVLKFAFMRERPDLDALVTETSYSFPSGHSMISMAFYGYLIYLIYKYMKSNGLKWCLISFLSILILLIGISRIYLGVHYASDVIGGFSFSIAYLIIYISVTKKMIKKI